MWLEADFPIVRESPFSWRARFPPQRVPSSTSDGSAEHRSLTEGAEVQSVAADASLYFKAISLHSVDFFLGGGLTAKVRQLRYSFSTTAERAIKP